MIRDEDIRNKLKEIDEHIRKEHIESQPKKERDRRTCEQRFSLRIKKAMKSLDPLIREAVMAIKVDESGPGRPDSLNLEQKVKHLLIKQLVGESNRMHANMLDIFFMVSGIDVSYKTIGRLYSDELVMMALHNLHVLLLKKKGVKNSDASADGTGYSPTISKHYQSIAKENVGVRGVLADGTYDSKANFNSPAREGIKPVIWVGQEGLGSEEQGELRQEEGGSGRAAGAPDG